MPATCRDHYTRYGILDDLHIVMAEVADWKVVVKTVREEPKEVTNNHGTNVGMAHTSAAPEGYLITDGPGP